MNFEKFKTLFTESQKNLEATVREFPWDQKDAYVAWLANSYHYVYNSTRILALAAGTMPPDKTQVSNRFIAHAAEEKSHEKLLENDVKSFGMKINDITVSPEMRSYYRSLYYWVSPAGNPLGLIGWVLSLEGLAANLGPWIHETVKKAHGGRAANFLSVHSDADPDHVEKALKLVTEFSPEDLRIVAEAMTTYCHQYASVLKAISHPNTHIKAA